MGLRPIPLIGERGEKGEYVRLEGMRRLEGWHTALAVGLSESKCFLVLCVSVPGLLRKAHPIHRAAEAGRPYARKKPICRRAYARPFSANPIF